MKRCKKASFTVEITLIMPIVLIVILIMFFFVLYMYNRGIMQNAAYRGVKQVFYYSGETNDRIKKECNKVVLADLDNLLVGVKESAVEIEVSATQVEIIVTGTLNVPKLIAQEGTVFERLWDYEIYAGAPRIHSAGIIISGQQISNIINETKSEEEISSGSSIQEGYEP